jgi:hypothetical protein
MHIFQDYEQRIITAFLKAADEGSLTIPCKDKSGAIALRARCYAMAKRVRKLVEKDPELAETAFKMGEIGLSITAKDELVFRRKDADPTMQALMDVLGETKVEVNQKMVNASLARVMEKLGGDEAPMMPEEPPPIQEAQPIPPVTQAVTGERSTESSTTGFGFADDRPQPPLHAPAGYPVRHKK